MGHGLRRHASPCTSAKGRDFHVHHNAVEKIRHERHREPCRGVRIQICERRRSHRLLVCQWWWHLLCHSAWIIIMVDGDERQWRDRLDERLLRLYLWQLD